MGNDTTADTATSTPDSEAAQGATAVGLLENKGFWKGKRLHLTDPAIVEKLRRKSLSPSTPKILTKDCPTRWAVEKLVGEGEENPFAPTFAGTCVHAVLEAVTVAPLAMRTPALSDRLVLEMSDVIFPLADEATDDEGSLQQQMTKACWTAEMAEADRKYFEMEDPTQVVLAETDMPELPAPKPTNTDTLEGQAVAVAERVRNEALAKAGFQYTPGIELNRSGVVLGERMVRGKPVGGVPSAASVDRVVQIGTPPTGTTHAATYGGSLDRPRCPRPTAHRRAGGRAELTGIRPVSVQLFETHHGQFVDVSVAALPMRFSHWMRGCSAMLSCRWRLLTARSRQSRSPGALPQCERECAMEAARVTLWRVRRTHK